MWGSSSKGFFNGFGLFPFDRRYPFVCHDSNGHILAGHNYDIKHEMTAMLMRSAAQKDSIPSLSLVDMGWFNYQKAQLSDGMHDNSLCISAPYLPVEVMNEKGLVICVLQLMNNSTNQDSGKKKPSLH